MQSVQPAVLTSWKEVASYLGKGVRTVQRWEKQDGLPIRRISGTSKIVVQRDDLDRWLHAQPSNLQVPKDSSSSHRDFEATPERGRQSRTLNVQLSASFSSAMNTLMDECNRMKDEHRRERMSEDGDDSQSAQCLLARTKPRTTVSNEELQSTNEELQTSKEELESANEELHTVNEEMQHRNELLSQLNNDLTNLLNSVNLPLVMVGSDLSVRRFTPQAASVLGLVASDVGRPIPRLKLKIEVDNLEQAMLDVLKDVPPKQYQVKDGDGNMCSFRLAPYRTLDNRIDGVVLSIVTLDGVREK